MAVAFDAVGPSAAGTALPNASSPLTWSHTCAAGAKLLVAISVDDSDTDNVTIAVTYAGSAMVSLGKANNRSGGQGCIELFAHYAPASGANTVSATVSGTVACDAVIGGSISFTGAAEFGAGIINQGTDTSPTFTAPSTKSDSIIAGFVSSGSDITAEPGTSRFLNNYLHGNGSADGNAGGATTPGTGSNVTMTWTCGGTWGVVGVEVFAAEQWVDNHHDRGVRQQVGAANTIPVTLVNPTAIGVGSVLVARIAADNSGSSGAARTISSITDSRNSWTNLGYSNCDPGAADAGTTCHLLYAPVGTAYQAGDTVTFNMSGNVTSAQVIIEEWKGLAVAGQPGANAGVKATGTASTNLPAIATSPAAAGYLVYTAVSVEGPQADTYTEDSDTTGGSWVPATKVGGTNATAASNQTTTGHYKWTTTADAQNWQGTISPARDSAAVGIAFVPGQQTEALVAKPSASSRATGTLTATVEMVAVGKSSARAPATLSKVTPYEEMIANARASARATGVLTATVEMMGLARASARAHGALTIPNEEPAYWFTDNTGQPQLFWSDEAWALLVNAGRYNGSDHAAAFGSYCDIRSGQGFTGVEVSMFSWTGDNTDFLYADGRDWDGVYPFGSSGTVGNSLLPSHGMNETFWARRDSLISTAHEHDMAVIFNVSTPLIENTGTLTKAWSTSEWSAYGSALANRYKNFDGKIIWMVGDDTGDTYLTQFSAFKTALRNAGDTHLISKQNYTETVSRAGVSDRSTRPWTMDAATWAANCELEWGYTYDVTYPLIEAAYAAAYAGGTPLAPILWGDGFFNYSYGNIEDRRLLRHFVWWALSSGARGVNVGDNNIWPWSSTAMGLLDDPIGTFSELYPAINSAFRNLPGWYELLPDLNNDLITAGRGAYATAEYGGTAGYNYVGDTDTWVSGSRTPDKTLAVIYMSHHTEITIDDAEMVSNYGATWLDPDDGSTKTATKSGTNPTKYDSNDAGTNSDGQNDWVLILQELTAVYEQLAASARASARATGAINVTAEMRASARAAARATGALNATVEIAASARSSARATGALKVTAELVAPTHASARATGTLSVTVELIAPTHAAARATGTLNVTAEMVTAARSSARATGSLTVTEPGATYEEIVASSRAAARATGTLTATVEMAAAARSSARATGILSATVEMIAAARSSARSTGTLNVTAELVGAARSAARATGDLTVTEPSAVYEEMVTVTHAAARATGTLNVTAELVATTSASSRAISTLSKQAPANYEEMTTSARASARAKGTLRFTTGKMRAASQASARATAALNATVEIVSKPKASARATGTLSVTAEMVTNTRACARATGTLGIRAMISASTGGSSRAAAAARCTRPLAATTRAAARATATAVPKYTDLPAWIVGRTATRWHAGPTRIRYDTGHPAVRWAALPPKVTTGGP